MADGSRRLVYSIVKFLKGQLSDGGLTEDSAESLEVGIQCLETAYNLNVQEPGLEIPVALQDVFRRCLIELQEKNRFRLSPGEKALAEIMKNEGNNHMSAQRYPEAFISYSKALQIDPANAVYFCNRAAASNKLGNYECAIRDCQNALRYDREYSKAYARMGMAHASKNDHQQAINNYSKAIELEPDNESYKNHLKSSQQALNAASQSTASFPLQSTDLAMVFRNPNLLSMATQMLSNPTMQTLMSSILSGNVPEQGSDVDVLLQASQQMADQMERHNPGLIDQLRRFTATDNRASRENRESRDSSSTPQKKHPRREKDS